MSDSPRRKRKTILFFVFAFILVIIVAAYIADRKAASNGLLVTISKETTYITEPLRPDGYPDYVAALNQRFSEGVTPENNEAVLFWQAVGPSEIEKEYRLKYFQMLGIPPLPEKGDYFIASDEHLAAYVTLHLKEGTAGDPSGMGAADPLDDSPPSESLGEQLNNQFESAMNHPWSKEEFPVWAEWLAANEKPLALLVEASKRPRRYDPYICGEDESAFCILLPGCQQHRDVARALCARAMLRLNQGDVELAWEDLLACHRLARLVGQGQFFGEALVAMTLDSMACAGDRALLEKGNLSAGQIAKIREDLANLPPMPSMAEIVDIPGRLMLLDTIAACASGRLDAYEFGFSGGGRKLSLESAVDSFPRHMIAWDYGLKLTNEIMDQSADACRLATQKERRIACDVIEEKINQYAGNSLTATKLLFSPRKVAAERFVTTLVPAVSAARHAEDRTTMRFEIIKLAFALAAYRADHGTYPEKLEELVPKYAEAIQKDIFNDEADLYYSRKEGGYLLYSIGPNGVDEGGKGYDDRKAEEDWDDISVRITAEESRQED